MWAAFYFVVVFNSFGLASNNFVASFSCYRRRYRRCYRRRYRVRTRRRRPVRPVRRPGGWGDTVWQESVDHSFIFGGEALNCVIWR